MKLQRQLRKIALVMGMSCTPGLIFTGCARQAPLPKAASPASGSAQEADKSAPAPTPRTPSAKIQFHAARAALYENFDERPGELRFESFLPLDWKQLARRDLRGFNVDHPTPQQLEQFKESNLPTDEVEQLGPDSWGMRFRSNLEPTVAAGFYYLMSSRGVDSLQLVRLEGIVAPVVDEQGTIESEYISGYVVAKAVTHKDEEGGFAVYSSAPVSFTPIPGTKFAARRQGDKTICQYEHDGMKWTTPLSAEGFIGDGGVESFTAYKIGLDEYVFVKWKPDISRMSPQCSRLYSLFKPGKNLLLVEVGESVSGCEID
jgi:hypothetical protein